MYLTRRRFCSSGASLVLHCLHSCTISVFWGIYSKCAGELYFYSISTTQKFISQCLWESMLTCGFFSAVGYCHSQNDLLRIKADEGWKASCIREWMTAEPYLEGEKWGFKVDVASGNAPFHISFALRSKALEKSRTVRHCLLKNRSWVKFKCWLRWDQHFTRIDTGPGCF